MLVTHLHWRHSLCSYGMEKGHGRLTKGMHFGQFANKGDGIRPSNHLLGCTEGPGNFTGLWLIHFWLFSSLCIHAVCPKNEPNLDRTEFKHYGCTVQEREKTLCANMQRWKPEDPSRGGRSLWDNHMSVDVFCVYTHFIHVWVSLHCAVLCLLSICVCVSVCSHYIWWTCKEQQIDMFSAFDEMLCVSKKAFFLAD